MTPRSPSTGWTTGSRTVPEAHATTVVAAVVDARAGELVWCTAGHPAPLLVPADGREPYYLSGSVAGSLGSGSSYERQTHRLAAGDVVLLYSDGLIERPGTPRSRGTVEVADAALRVLGPDGMGPDHESRVERIVRRLPARLIEGRGATDDVVVLGVELKAAPTRELRLELRRSPTACWPCASTWTSGWTRSASR